MVVSFPMSPFDPALLARAHAGDPDAIALVVTGNRPLVLHVRARHAPSLDYDDAVQIGSIGLLRAIERYDPARGAWSNCAYQWIRNALARATRTDNLIRHPHAREYGNAPGITWTDAPREKGQRPDLPSTDAGPLQSAEDADERAWLHARVAALDPRSAAVIRRRFGLDGREPALLSEIGDELGISRERVRQIVNDAIAILGGREVKPRRKYARRAV